MIDRRRALLAMAVLATAPAFAQPRRFRVGIVWNSPPQADLDRRASHLRSVGFLETGLRDLGWVDGKNIELISRSAEMRYDRFPKIIESLVEMPVDVIVVFSPESARVAQARTSTIPIVSAGGYVGTASPRPTGNLTGVSYIGSAPPMKRLELLKALAPAISVVAMFAMVPPGVEPPRLMPHHHEAAKSLGLTLFVVYFERPEDLDKAYGDAKRRGANAVYMSAFPLLTWYEPVQRQVLELGARHRVPVAYEVPDLARLGGLLAYGVDDSEGARRAPHFIDKLLRGARPADLPIEQVNRVYLNINRRTARELGLSVPPALLVQADNIYE